MEDVEKPSVVNSSIDEAKNNCVSEGLLENSVTSMETDVCHKSNGVVEKLQTVESTHTAVPTDETTAQEDTTEEVVTVEIRENVEDSVSEAVHSSQEPSAFEETNKVVLCETVVEEGTTIISTPESETVVNESTKNNVECIEITADDDVEKTVIAEETVVEESVVEIDGIVESTNDRVMFKTEILVETNVNDINENHSNEIQNVKNDNTTNILNELGQNIELSEMLRSSDTHENIENNNCAPKQEVFNKEELLDILQGNDAEEVEPSTLIVDVTCIQQTPLEKELALQQLSRLKSSTKRAKTVEPQIKKRRKDKNKVVSRKEKEPPKVKENIITALVKEWEDDEPVQGDDANNVLDESEDLLQSTNDLIKAQETVNSHDKSSVRSSIDSSTSDKQTPNLDKSCDDSLPQRRLSRVIKKKVIFDPDNPDTFTKGKSALKNKDSQLSPKQNLTPIKKNKSEHVHQQTRGKLPMSKLQWKKPPPKNSHKYKRLSEVDKLLMDEGAVNMIFQLAPEASKGKKNMQTKAEFIKNFQRSTPNSKEMKFRERKKDSRSEDGEPRKIAGGKKRSSLNSSVKSPSVCEDFEAHSADDSIIYRRHSSSSYSSSCMSPLRLSDVESSIGHNVNNINHEQNNKETNVNESISANDTIVSEQASTPNKIINKKDCLSIKEKLNSKLSLALNKRKQESTNNEKPAKLKKVSKLNEKQENINEYKYLTINIENRLSEIFIKNPGSNYNIEVIKELESALVFTNSREDVSVTLLMSECGSICTGIDLKPLLIENLEAKTKYAHDIAESVRSLLITMDQHKKLLCMGVDGDCASVGLALVAMCDVSIASESASFTLQSCKPQSSPLSYAPLVPGISVLSAAGQSLSKSLLSDLVVFGHKVSASDALRHGLITRTVWPGCFREQLLSIAKDIASQPTPNILLKKQLLNIRKSELLSTCIEKERDMLIQYWTSPEGQKLIHAAYGTT